MARNPRSNLWYTNFKIKSEMTANIGRKSLRQLLEDVSIGKVHVSCKSSTVDDVG